MEKSYTLEEVKAIALKFTKAATPSEYIVGIEERFNQVWDINFPSQPSEQKPLEKSIGDILYKYENWLNKDSTRPFFVREDVAKAMQEYASQERQQARNETVDECINLATEGRTVRIDLIKTLEKLKQK